MIHHPVRKDAIPRNCSEGVYVYVHYRPDDTPFYVGKGSGQRAYTCFKRNPAYSNCVAKHGAENIHIRVYPQDTEEEAFAAEVRLIAEFKRAGFKLHNIAPGGLGSAKGRIISQTVRDKISKTMSGRPHPPTRLGAVNSPEHRARISKALTGLRHSSETKNKLSVIATGRIVSAETKAKQSAAAKADWAKRKSAKIADKLTSEQNAA